MNNMLSQFLTGLAPVVIFTAFVIYAVYVFKTKVQPFNDMNDNENGSENENKN